MDRAPAAAPDVGDDWVALIRRRRSRWPPASAWVVRPDCGATVTFTGTARDHAPGRPGVHRLEYEAYEEPAVGADAGARRPRRAAAGPRSAASRCCTAPASWSWRTPRWSSPSPPRTAAEAFEAARFAIDELKRSVPIWKREAWAGGESWGLEAQHIAEVSGTPS